MMNNDVANTIRVFAVCTGIGLIRRGIESQTWDMFKGLHGRQGLDIKLFKGQGKSSIDEYRLWNLSRTDPFTQAVAHILRRSSYVTEQISSFVPFVWYIRKYRPHVIYYSEQSLGFQLYRWREWIGVPYRLLLNNSGPGQPPFRRTHFVHQCTPYWIEQALAAGEEPSRHILVPVGIDMSERVPILDEEVGINLRIRLGLPVDSKIILSVGFISDLSHKRMDYLIDEVAALPQPRPHLVMLGQMDESSQVLIDKAQFLLGNNFTVRSVPYEQVSLYYQCADLFALCSLTEGFGRVYIESLMHGLPTVSHDQVSMRYVLGNEGVFIDMSKSGNLAQQLPDLLAMPKDRAVMQRRQNVIHCRYSWDSLASDYINMFRYCMEQPLPPYKW